MAIRPDVIIKKQKEERYTLIDVVTPAERNFTQKEAEKKKITNVYSRYTKNVYYVNWSQWNSNKMCKGKFGRHARKTSKRFTKTRQTLYV